MGAPFVQTNYTLDTASQYKAKIDADIQVLAGRSAAYNVHAVPVSPGTPVLSQSAAGALAAATYYVKVTYVTAAGETAPSLEASLAVNANNVLGVAAPAWIAEATGWNVYVGTASGAETKQNASPIAMSANWAEPTTGVIAGAALPTGISRMAVIVDPGTMLVNGAVVSNVTQLSSTAAAPVSQPRIDLIVADAFTGVISTVTGAEAASPVAPLVPAGKYPLATVAMAVGQTAIINANITDYRTPVVSLPDSVLQSKYTFYAGAFGGTADALSVTISSGLTSIPDGMTIIGKAGFANATATPTLTVTLGTSSSGAIGIVKGANAPLLAGDIAGANGEPMFVYNASLAKWVLMNPQAAQPSLCNTVPMAANTTLTAANNGQFLLCSGTITLTLTAAATLGNGWYCYIANGGAGSITLSTGGVSNLIQFGGSGTAGSSITVPDTGSGANPYNNSVIMVLCDGSNFKVVPVATPHGSVTFTANGTWTCPEGVFTVWLTGFGGGGGGGTGGSSTSGATVGNGGAGGSAGQKAVKMAVAVVPGTSYTITIGVGGGSAASGGATSFGALLTLSGGSPGLNGLNSLTAGANTPGGSGATGSGPSGGQAGRGSIYTTQANPGGAAPANSGSGGGGGGGQSNGGTFATTAGGQGGSGILTIDW